MFFYKELIPAVPLVLTASVNTLTFPDTCIGTSSLMTVSISAASLLGSEVEIVSVGDDSDQFDFSPVSFALTGGVTNQLVDVTFTPTSWGQKSASLTLSASNGSNIVVHLEGLAAAVPLVLTSSVNSVTLSDTLVNTISTQTFTVSAGGFSSVKEIVTLSDNTNQFDFSPSSFALTGSGASQTVTVTFAPTTTGTLTGSLTLSSSGGSTKSVSLSALSYGPLSFTYSTSSFLFSELALTGTYAGTNSGSTSQNITISATGYAGLTETVTLTDNTDQYDYSPSSFSISGGGSQVVAVNFRPTTSSPTKLGTFTISSSLGSTNTVALTGSARRYLRVPQNNTASALVYGSGKTPANPTDGSEGWYFINSVANQSAQYYYVSFPNQSGSVGPGEKLSTTSSMTAYTVVRFTSVTSSQNAPGKFPIIALYTQPQGAGDAVPGYYRSKISYYPSGSRGASSPYTSGVDYLFYTNTDPKAHPEIPANRRFKLLTNALNQFGPRVGTEDFEYFSVGTDTSGIAVNCSAIIVRNAGTEFTDRMDEMVFLKSGSV